MEELNVKDPSRFDISPKVTAEVESLWDIPVNGVP